MQMKLFSRSLHVVDDLGVADLLGESRTAAESARRSERTRRPRAAAASAVGPQRVRGLRWRVSHSPGRGCCAPSSPVLAPLLRMFGLRFNSAGFGVARAVGAHRPTGRGSGVAAGMFDYFAERPEAGAHLRRGHDGQGQRPNGRCPRRLRFLRVPCHRRHRRRARPLLPGHARTHPRRRGAFDLPNVLPRSRPGVGAADAGRPGDFFKRRLPVCDAYLLMEVIHELGDASPS